MRASAVSTVLPNVIVRLMKRKGEHQNQNRCFDDTRFAGGRGDPCHSGGRVNDKKLMLALMY